MHALKSLIAASICAFILVNPALEDTTRDASAGKYSGVFKNLLGRSRSPAMDAQAQAYETGTSYGVDTENTLSTFPVGKRRTATETIDAPYISSLVPNHGSGTYVVTIVGENFGTAQGTSVVSFHDGLEANVLNWTEGEIQCEVPVGAVTGEVTVATEEGTSNGALFTVVIPYYDEMLIPHEFEGGGTGMGWHADDACWEYALPFEFPYFETPYSSVYVCSNGFLDFTSNSPYYWNSLDRLRNRTMIAPCWDDLMTNRSGEDIYIHQPSEDIVAIRWEGSSYSEGLPVNLEIILSEDGAIQFNYGDGNTGLTPTIGISKGDGIYYQISPHDGRSALTDIDSVRYLPAPPACRDVDQDGYGSAGSNGLCDHPQEDCQDLEPDINPGAEEDCCNQSDDDCDGHQDRSDPDCTNVCVDCDGDGYGYPGNSLCEYREEDCSDFNPAINPGAEEDCCNQSDDDCDGYRDRSDPDCTNVCVDCDGDGYGYPGNSLCEYREEDCSDSNPAINPGAEEDCCNYWDDDCDGYQDRSDPDCTNVCMDCDGDGYGYPGNSLCEYREEDCSDSNPAINPGAEEDCFNGRDDNCNGHTDGWDPDCADICVDRDDDGYGSPGNSLCEYPEEDCADWDPAINPGAEEHCCNYWDDDCDGHRDMSDPDCTNVCVDCDGDGYGSPGNSLCEYPEEDCADWDPDVNPGAEEDCFNGRDDDCDRYPDDLDSDCSLLVIIPYYDEVLLSHEFEESGTRMGWRADDACWQYALPFEFPYFETPYSSVYVCSNGFLDFKSNFSDPWNSLDGLRNRTMIAPCWDDLSTYRPGEDIHIHHPSEDAVAIRWAGSTNYEGLPVNVEVILSQDGIIQFNYGDGNTDLTPTIGISRGDGLYFQISPHNGRSVLTDVDSVRYLPATAACRDADQDGYGSAASSLCDHPEADCRDSDPAINPGAEEDCFNGRDDNCNGHEDGWDPDCADICVDRDDDGYGSPGNDECDYPEEDCADGVPAINPGAEEDCCNYWDDDCDGYQDRSDPDCTNVCVDCDGDGYGSPGNGLCEHSEEDCEDSSSAIHPGAEEDCFNGRDDNCNGHEDGWDPDCAYICVDRDDDGYGSPGNDECDYPEEDCADGDPAINPGAEEDCSNRSEAWYGSEPIDDDCDGAADYLDLDCSTLAQHPDLPDLIHNLKDWDLDGATNREELEFWWYEHEEPIRDAQTIIDHISNPDMDRDRVPDGLEIRLGTDPKSFNLPHLSLTLALGHWDDDDDSDGLINGLEIICYKTNPKDADTDCDGIGDMEEIIRGSDPTNVNSVPDYHVLIIGSVRTFSKALDRHVGVNGVELALCEGDCEEDQTNLYAQVSTHPMFGRDGSFIFGIQRVEEARTYYIDIIPPLPGTGALKAPPGELPLAIYIAPDTPDRRRQVHILLDGYVDGDGDGVPIEVETQYSTSDSDTDSDDDGMPDGWEIVHFLNSGRKGCCNPNLKDGAGDPDGDQLTNLEEYDLQSPTDPNEPFNVPPCAGSDPDPTPTSGILMAEIESEQGSPNVRSISTHTLMPGVVMGGVTNELTGAGLAETWIGFYNGDDCAHDGQCEIVLDDVVARENGIFFASLPNGHYWIRACKDGYYPRWAECDVHVGRPSDFIRLILRPSQAQVLTPDVWKLPRETSVERALRANTSRDLIKSTGQAEDDIDRTKLFLPLPARHIPEEISRITARSSSTTPTIAAEDTPSSSGGLYRVDVTEETTTGTTISRVEENELSRAFVELKHRPGDVVTAGAQSAFQPDGEVTEHDALYALARALGKPEDTCNEHCDELLRVVKLEDNAWFFSKDDPTGFEDALALVRQANGYLDPPLPENSRGFKQEKDLTVRFLNSSAVYIYHPDGYPIGSSSISGEAEITILSYPLDRSGSAFRINSLLGESSSPILMPDPTDISQDLYPFLFRGGLAQHSNRDPVGTIVWAQQSSAEGSYSILMDSIMTTFTVYTSQELCDLFSNIFSNLPSDICPDGPLEREINYTWNVRGSLAVHDDGETMTGHWSFTTYPYPFVDFTVEIEVSPKGSD